MTTDPIAIAEAGVLGVELLELADDAWTALGSDSAARFNAWQSSGMFKAPRVREIGEQLNRLGGYEAMSASRMASQRFLNAQTNTCTPASCTNSTGHGTESATGRPDF